MVIMVRFRGSGAGPSHIAPMKAKLIQQPVQEPLSLEEVQAHLRVDGEDVYLNALIVSVRVAVERYLNRVLITQTWQVWWNCWECNMPLPYPPLQSLESFTYIGTDGTEQTLEDGFWLSDKADPACIVQKYDFTYPELQLGRPDCISAIIVCGYGLRDSVPDPIKHAMKLWITDLYEHRGSVVIGSVNKIPAHVTALLHSYKMYEF